MDDTQSLCCHGFQLTNYKLQITNGGIFSDGHTVHRYATLHTAPTTDFFLEANTVHRYATPRRNRRAIFF
jgi:hypothetical protein